MAGSAVTELQIKLTTKGVDKLPQLSRAFSTFGRDVKKTELNFKQFAQELRKHGSENAKSINNTRALANTWKELAASVDFGSKEFREATAEAKRLNIELNKMEKGGSRGIGGRLRGAAKTIGAVSAAGIFGGPEGLIGAGLGAFGGPGGAVVGGAIGASLGGVRQSIGEMGKYNASLKQQRFALKLVINDTEKYNQAQQFLAKTSEELAIPQDVIVRQFTALTASVVGAGKSVEDAQDVFLSIASGIRGTGGSLEDMRSAMVATAQVFSKGKVSAEELRQQLGERLPGAFTLFAASMNKTPAELDKALEQGKVTLEDFLGFSKHLFNNYAENSKILATSPAAAGDRLATEFSKFKDIFGGLFANIGAGLQDTTTNILRFFNNNEETIKNSIKDIVNITTGSFRVLQKIGQDLLGFLGGVIQKFFDGIKIAVEKVVGFINGVIKTIRVTLEAFGGAFRKLGLGRFLDVPLISISEETTNTLKTNIEKVTDPLKDYKQELENLFNQDGKTVEEVFGTPEFDKLIEKIQKAKHETNKTADATGKLNKGFSETSKLAEEVGKTIRSGIVDTIESAITGAKSLNEVLNGVLRSIGRMYLQAAVNQIPLPGLNAKGNVYAQNGIVPFAKGGIVSQPTIFPFKNGIGLMGEAGEEAVMPLRRGRDGRLGVESSGAGVGNIVVNVDASGSSVEGDSGQAEALGSILGAAIQAEIVNQQRPGGLLA
tara:strand:- start:173 stop:2323 length:2151 start_codon:yes stop_codon:yes gene_type:complete